MPAQSQNPFPLDIGTKEDSWDKLQLLQYLDPSLKITAAELNKIVRALEFLYGNITTGGYMGNVPATFRRANIDFNDPIGTPITKVRDFINGMPNHVIPNGYEQWFFTYRAVLTNDQGQSTPGGRHFAIIAEYYLLTKKIPPIAGVASIGTGGTQITTADLIKLYERDSRSAEPVEYDLGNIGTSEIWDAADGSGPRPTPNTVTTLFRAIQGGTEKIWLYIGGQEEVGTGYPVTDANDYREISSDGSGMDPEPPSSDVRILSYEFIVDEMLTDQARQSTQNIIFVEKAHEDLSLNFPQGETRTYAHYQLRNNATKTGSLSDYRLISAPWANVGTDFDPDNYDLEQFKNESQDPFVRHSNLPAPFDPTQIENAIQDLENNKQPKDLVYPTIAAMIAAPAQAVQVEGVVIRVDDAGEDTRITFPAGTNRVAYYQKLATSTASLIDDYVLISAPFGYYKKNLQRKITSSRSMLNSDNGATLIFNGTGLELVLDQDYVDNFEVYLYNKGTTAVTFIDTMFSGWTLSQESLTLYPKETCAIIADGASKNLMIIGNYE